MASTVEIIINAKDNASSVLKGVAGTLGSIAKVAGAAALAGGAALGAFLTSTVKDAMEAENALAQLNAVIKSTGGVAGVSSDEVVALADSLSQVTRFTDEAVMSGASMLLTFTNIGEEVFPQATETILDMSQALGQDLQSSAIQLGKALNDPIEGVTALRRVGVQFTDAQEKLIKSLVQSGKLEEAQAMILKELQTEFGGSAKAAGETFAGQVDILKNKISNLKEGIGQALLPALGRLADGFGKVLSNPAVLQFIDNFSKGVGNLANRLIDLFSSGQAFDLSFVTAMFKNWADSVDWATLSTDLANGIKNIDFALVGQEIRAAFINIMDGLGTIFSEVNWGALGASLAESSNELFAGLFGYDTFGQLASDFWAGWEYTKAQIALAISSAGPLLKAKGMELITRFKEGTLQNLMTLVGIGRMIIEKILSGIKSAANSIYALVKSIIDKIKAMFNALKITLNIPGVTGGGGSTGGGSGGSHTTGGTGGAGQQQRAIGGSVFSGRQYLIGEHGPELFTPSMGGYITPNNKLAMEGMSGGGLVINLTYAPAVSLASEAELEQHLMPVILKGVRQARRGY